MRNRVSFIALAVLLLLCPLGVEAATHYTEGYFAYTDQGYYSSVIEYFGKEETVIIPAVLGGKPVARIEKNVFAETESVKKVKIPDTVIDLDDNALKSNGTLEEVSFYSVSKEESNFETPNQNRESDQDKVVAGTSNIKGVEDYTSDYEEISEESSGLADAKNGSVSMSNSKNVIDNISKKNLQNNFGVDAQVLNKDNNFIHEEQEKSDRISLNKVLFSLLSTVVILSVVIFLIYRKRNKNETKTRNRVE